MQQDEREIRELVETWMTASSAGDIETVLSLMSEDVVFLLPGQQSMIGKAAFAEASRAMAGSDGPRIEGTSEIQEINVLGDWAYMWTRLSVVIMPSDGSPSMTRAGFTLSVLKKEDGRWLLARDANLLSPVVPPCR